MKKRPHDRSIRTWRGLRDDHCHIDRCNTYDPIYFDHAGVFQGYIDAPLPVKQNITGVLHDGYAYTEKSLRDRMTRLIKDKIAAGETHLKAIVDCSPDIDGRAFKVALELREQFKDVLTIDVGAYPIFGFKDRGSDRYRHLRTLAPHAQFLVGLPEREEREGHTIGFDGHLALLIEIAHEFSIPEIQVHVDQTNTPGERGAERLIEAVHWLIKESGLPRDKRPKVWAVHDISSACDDDAQFEQHIEGLLENDMGVIVGPHAALSMRQRREFVAPVHNSIARVLELVLAGVSVRFGTDNIRDLFMPLPDVPYVSREVEAFASAVRFYDKAVLWKLFAGERLNETDRENVVRALEYRTKTSRWLAMRRK